MPLIQCSIAKEDRVSFYLKDGVYTHTDTQEHILYAEGTKSGTSLQDILTHPAIDATRTLSDHITEVYEVLGIEAVRELIRRELAKVIDASGGTPQPSPYDVARGHNDCPRAPSSALTATASNARTLVLLQNVRLKSRTNSSTKRRFLGRATMWTGCRPTLCWVRCLRVGQEWCG